MQPANSSRYTIGIVPAILLFVTLSALLFGERYVTGVDPANYLLGMRSYSIAQERPHPPGYPVFIALARCAEPITGSDHAALRLVIILFAAAALAGVYMLSRAWIGVRGAWIATALLALNPLFWFYASTSENYVCDAAFGPFLVLLLLRARGRWWIPAGLFIGLELGVRTASAALLVPLALGLVRMRFRERSLGWHEVLLLALGVLLGIAVWLPAVVISENGIAGILHGLTSESAGTFTGNLAGLAITLFWTVHLAGIYWSARAGTIMRALAGRSSEGRRSGVASALALWILPPLFFFALVIHTKGYLLLLLPALSIGTAWLIVAERPRVGLAITALLLFTNAVIYLIVPALPPEGTAALAPRNRSAGERFRALAARTLSAYLPAWSVIRERDLQIGTAVAAIGRAVGAGADTTIVVVDPAGSTYAHPRILQYYLPTILFAMPGVRNDRLMTYHRGIDKWRRFGGQGTLAARTLLLFTDRRLIARYPYLAPVWQDAGTEEAILVGGGDLGGRLRSTMEQLFTRWDQAGAGPAAARP